MQVSSNVFIDMQIIFRNLRNGNCNAKLAPFQITDPFTKVNYTARRKCNDEKIIKWVNKCHNFFSQHPILVSTECEKFHITLFGLVTQRSVVEVALRHEPANNNFLGPRKCGLRSYKPDRQREIWSQKLPLFFCIYWHMFEVYTKV